MSQEPHRLELPYDKVEDGDAESGLTSDIIRPVPVLFGSRVIQNRLLHIARNGEARLQPKETKQYLRLTKAGICNSQRVAGRDIVTLNAWYPAANEIQKVLEDLLGEPITTRCTEGSNVVESEKPLMHRTSVPFHILVTIVRADEPLNEEALRRHLPFYWPQGIALNLGNFVRDGVLVKGEGGTYKLADAVPQSFSALVLRLGEVIADPRLVPSIASGKRVFANQQAEDGAPRFFGTDIRLRNLMALAIYGPMQQRDLRNITGAYHLRDEGRDDAPFGRGNVVRTWETPDGTALALNEAHPLYPPLLRFLVRLAEVYPLRAHVPKFNRPDPPPPQAWHGDRLALFGSRLPTSVLMSMAGRGWTFEAICCEVATGFDRVVVKKTTRRLEEEGVLQGSRPRGPGFGPRLLSLAETCPAREELQALIDAVPVAWTDLGDRIDAAFAGIRKDEAIL